MQQFSRTIGFKLTFGAGEIVDKQLMKFIEIKGYDAFKGQLPNFKNIKKNNIVPHL